MSNIRINLTKAVAASAQPNQPKKNLSVPMARFLASFDITAIDHNGRSLILTAENTNADFMKVLALKQQGNLLIADWDDKSLNAMSKLTDQVDWAGLTSIGSIYPNESEIVDIFTGEITKPSGNSFKVYLHNAETEASVKAKRQASLSDVGA